MTTLYQIAVKQVLLNQELRNVFYYEAAAALSDAQLIELADAIRAAYVSALMPAKLATAWSLYGIDARRVDVAELLGTDWGFTSGSLAGSNGGQAYATQIALIVLGKGTTVRPNSVRSYLGGWTEDFVGGDGKFTSATLVVALAFIEAMDSHALTGDTVVRQSAKWASPSATHVVSWNPLTTYEAKAIPATQRRRRIGVGI